MDLPQQRMKRTGTTDRQEAMLEKRQKQKEREEKWVETQIIGFTAWINSYLHKRNKKIVNLEKDFQDGLMLVDFLELASLLLLFVVICDHEVVVFY
jgi:hypothetical protein